MCATHLLIMLYLSVKFHQICFSSVRDAPSHYFLSFCEVSLKFASAVFELLARYNFDLLPDCDHHLGRRNLCRVRDTEVSSNLLQ